MVYAIQMWQSVVIEYKLLDVISTKNSLQIEEQNEIYVFSYNEYFV